MPSKKKDSVQNKNESADYSKKLNYSLKQLEFIEQLEFHLRSKNSNAKTILEELQEMKFFTQIETIKFLKNLNDRK